MQSNPLLKRPEENHICFGIHKNHPLIRGIHSSRNNTRPYIYLKFFNTSTSILQYLQNYKMRFITVLMSGTVRNTINGKKHLVMMWKKRIDEKLKMIKEIYIGNMENLANILDIFYQPKR